MFRQSGITLVELLVVITLLALITSVTVPVVAPAIRDRETREAARLVQSFLSAARTEAAGRGRPVGVRFLPGSSGTNASLTLAMVEVPVPYCGDTTSSRMAVAVNGFARFVTGDTGWVGLLHIGDQVKLNYMGPLYEISAGDVDASGALTAENPGFILKSPLGYFNATQADGVPFQIYPQPGLSAKSSLQLPGSSAVDLSISGMSGREFAVPDSTPTVLFSPNGSVQYVYFSGSFMRPAHRIFFMIGKAEKTLYPVSDPNSNWRDLGNYWISINAFNGQIATTENAAIDPSITDPDTGIVASRAFAQTGQQMGNR